MSEKEQEIRLMEIAKDLAIATTSLKEFDTQTKEKKEDLVLNMFRKSLKVVREEVTAK
jgi:hypothetical protein